MGQFATLLWFLVVAYLCLQARAEVTATGSSSTTGKMKSKSARSLTDKELQLRRTTCESKMGLVDSCLAKKIDKENCILKCVSESCYKMVYEPEPLEEGEVDASRWLRYRRCFREELRGVKKAQLRDAAKKSTAARSQGTRTTSAKV